MTQHHDAAPYSGVPDARAKLRFEAAAGGPGSLQRLDVVIRHIKPSLRAGEAPGQRIAEQLAAGNRYAVRLHYSLQGQRMLLPTPQEVMP